VLPCPAAPAVIAVRAGRLFNSRTGRILTAQVVVVSGERIAAVAPAGRVTIPLGAVVVDLSRATVLPGLIDAHTHMFDTRKPNGTAEEFMLIAVQNARLGLRAGFTAARDLTSHGNGYGDVAIRMPSTTAVSTGHVTRSPPGALFGVRNRKTPRSPKTRWRRQSFARPQTARVNVRDQIAHGDDWIKLYPAGGYSFIPSGEGLQNAITAGCDTIEHAPNGKPGKKTAQTPDGLKKALVIQLLRRKDGATAGASTR